MKSTIYLQLMPSRAESCEEATGKARAKERATRAVTISEVKVKEKEKANGTKDMPQRTTQIGPPLPKEKEGEKAKEKARENQKENLKQPQILKQGRKAKAIFPERAKAHLPTLLRIHSGTTNSGLGHQMTGHGGVQLIKPGAGQQIGMMDLRGGVITNGVMMHGMRLPHKLLPQLQPTSWPLPMAALQIQVSIQLMKLF